MTPQAAARSLLSKIPLPRGTVSVMVLGTGTSSVMHVYVDKAYMHRANVPAKFEGYDVVVEERHSAHALA